MLNLFSLFGRAREIERLRGAVRAVGLHPNLVPDAVEITVVRLLKDAGDTSEPATARAAELLAYVMLGAEEFAAVNDPRRAAAAEARLLHAVDTGDSLDARLVLLCLNAGLAHPALVEAHGLESA